MPHSETFFPSRRRPRSSSSKSATRAFGLPSIFLLAMLIAQSDLTSSFGLNSQTARTQPLLSQRSLSRQQQQQAQRTSSTALNVWWFGGTEQNEQDDDESCELVAVRIERPTSNSRKIAGELSVPGVTVEDVWSILTDYDRLSIHVPNLKESKIVRENSYGAPGDGSYKCQLFQVGAQKIIGFDFSASVTMDMTEQILSASTSNARKIHFKCAKSQFFSAFDGSWTVQEQLNPATGEPEVLCSYDVLVKPKGPVPVAALEWRIREDVPTNLRAVKAATLKKVSTTTTMPEQNEIKTVQNLSSSRMLVERQQPRQLAAVMVDWERGETMAKYLE
eukprot:CAMPEP_0116124728 /NCGR_PEP_ID=MMETSP0329-20121206/5434_1 /TAXON_ID=697910 /ORGANISM="Pseudo-nitzschia arenysensis, Strain B593" /LENGTH=332 /DNA_ID=CAMNT_0003618725 /DNA_START=119 /DNA_END=1117 /DNA_ORIENTATION=+